MASLVCQCVLLEWLKTTLEFTQTIHLVGTSFRGLNEIANLLKTATATTTTTVATTKTITATTTTTTTAASSTTTTVYVLLHLNVPCLWQGFLNI